MDDEQRIWQQYSTLDEVNRYPMGPYEAQQILDVAGRLLMNMPLEHVLERLRADTPSTIVEAVETEREFSAQAAELEGANPKLSDEAWRAQQEIRERIAAAIRARKTPQRLY